MEHLIESFTVVELRELCRKLNIPIGGLKHEIAQRIFKYFAQTQPVIPETSIPANPSLPKLTRTTIFGAFTRRFSKLNSQPTDSSNPLSHIESNAVGLTVISIKSFADLCIQKFGLFISRLTPVFAFVGGTYALIQLYNMGLNEKLEVYVVDRSFM